MGPSTQIRTKTIIVKIMPCQRSRSVKAAFFKLNIDVKLEDKKLVNIMINNVNKLDFKESQSIN